MRQGLQQKKRPKIIDVIVSLCIIGVLFGIVIARYQRVYHEARKTALRSELTNIRSSIDLFRMLNGRNPRDLTELMEKNVVFPARIGQDSFTGSIWEQKYLMSSAVDEDGIILDAFGNPFQYNPVSAEVRATTKGYEDW